MNRFFICFSELRQLRTKFKNIRRPDRAVPPVPPATKKAKIDTSAETTLLNVTFHS